MQCDGNRLVVLSPLPVGSHALSMLESVIIDTGVGNKCKGKHPHIYCQGVGNLVVVGNEEMKQVKN